MVQSERRHILQWPLCFPMFVKKPVAPFQDVFLRFSWFLLNVITLLLLYRTTFCFHALAHSSSTFPGDLFEVKGFGGPGLPSPRGWRWGFVHALREESQGSFKCSFFKWMYIFGACWVHPELQRFYCFFLFYSIEVDSLDLTSSVGEVQFTVRIQERVPGQSELFCCLYRSQEGHYSAFSPYLQLEDQNGLCVWWKLLFTALILTFFCFNKVLVRI